MLVYVVFLVLVCATNTYAGGELQDVSGGCWDSSWVKISHHTVCLETKGNRYGSFNNYIREGLVTAIKLEYVSGEVRCIGGVEYNSRWGCSNYATFKNYPLDIVVTDNNNNIVFPKQEYIKYPYGLWYWLPFVDTKYSKELIFTDYRMPFYFPLDKEMRIWYGEDLKNWSEGNNAGRLCVNVYAKFKL